MSTSKRGFKAPGQAHYSPDTTVILLVCPSALLCGITPNPIELRERQPRSGGLNRS